MFLALLGGSGLLIYPGARNGWRLVGPLFASDSLERSFAALGLIAFVTLAAAGAALIALGVGLLRGNRVAQVLTCILCADVALAEVASSSAGGTSARVGGTLATATALVCAGVVILVAVLPGARRYFSRDSGGPLGVLLASAAAAYFGACMALLGLLLLVGGALDTKYIGYGLGLVAAGAALMGSLRRLRAGHAVARVVVSLAFLGCVVLMFLSVGSGGAEASVPTILPLGLAIAALYGLWLAPSSQQHFAAPQTLPRMPAAAVAGWLVLLLATGGLVALGASSNDSPFAAAPQAFPTPPVGSAAVGDTPAYSPATQPMPSNTPAFGSVPPATDTGGPASMVPVGAMDHVWTTTYSATGGYLVAVRLAVGAPQKLVPGLTNGQLTAGSGCSDINADTDAVVPAELTLTNQSGSFTTYAAYSVSYDYGYSNAEAEIYYTDTGATCKDSGGFGGEFNGGLAPGGTGHADIFFVVRNYFTPNNPSGDPAALAAARIVFSDASSEQMQFTVGTTSGPGVDGSGTFSLAGS